ncbi:MAG TPA: hypothetical protein VFF30_15835 [Nitrososphaerales archaeon]|nr:hypothetical protein [Nitrososphaerales archaeon]
MAPTIYVERSIAVLIAFFLGLGVGAHALDETMGNPLRTRLSTRSLYALGATALSFAVVIGLYYSITLSPLLLPIIFAELFFAIAYNLEILEKKFHSAIVFSLSWGVIPFFTGYFVNALSISLPVILMSAVIGILTIVQRTLSTQARYIRRKVPTIERVHLQDGSTVQINSADLAQPAEIALKGLTVVVFLLAAALVLLRFA